MAYRKHFFMLQCLHRKLADWREVRCMNDRHFDRVVKTYHGLIARFFGRLVSLKLMLKAA